MKLDIDAEIHLSDIVQAPEDRRVLNMLNKIDLLTLSTLTERDITLFIEDRASRWCLLVGGYVKHDGQKRNTGKKV